MNTRANILKQRYLNAKANRQAARDNLNNIKKTENARLKQGKQALQAARVKYSDNPTPAEAYKLDEAKKAVTAAENAREAAVANARADYARSNDIYRQSRFQKESEAYAPRPEESQASSERTNYSQETDMSQQGQRGVTGGYREDLSQPINSSYKEGRLYNDTAHDPNFDGNRVIKDRLKRGAEKGLGVLKNAANDFRMSDSFYRDIGASLSGRPTGNVYDEQAIMSRNLAADARNTAANRDMEAQQAQQIANRDAYTEAGKVASVQNAAENKQAVNNTGFAAGTASALNRKTNTPDVMTQQSMQNEQRQAATEQRAKADREKKLSTREQGESNSMQINSRDEDRLNDTRQAVTMGEGFTSEGEEQNGEGADGQPQPPEPQETQDDLSRYNTTWQDVMNYMTYGNDPSSKWSKPDVNANAKAAADAMGWAPLTQEDVSGLSNGFNSSTSELQNIMQSKRGEFMESWKKGSNRVQNGQQLNYGDEGYDEASQTALESGTPSDARIKDLKHVLSDFRMKCIREDFDRDGDIEKNDRLWLMKMMGQGLDDDDMPDETILPMYAEHIKNYVYNYKPEAQELDPSDDQLDPEQEHIGPMAQDIESVNPACIKETPEGVKTVDTARLAMMNAGAIGDIARQLEELTNKLKALGID